MDLENDPELLEIVEQAAVITDSKHAVIALVDNDILHIKVCKCTTQTKIALNASLCAPALNGSELLMVYNTARDKRFAGHYNVVGGLGIKSITAMPLTTPDGKNIGVLAVYDVRPKILNSQQQLFLKLLAKQAFKLMELRAGAELLVRNNQELEKQRQLNNIAAIRLRSFFESSLNFHVLLDRNSEVIDFNKTAVNFIKTVHKTVINTGDNFVQYLHPAFVSTFLKRFAESLEGKRAFEEGSTDYEDLGTIWWEAAFEPARNENNEIIGVSYLIRNVTERKLKEQKIIEQNKSLLKIAHIQAHEFRAPLTSIMGLMNLIEGEDYNPPREYLELLNDAVNQLDNKIRGIVADIDNTIITPYVPHYQ